MSFRVILYGCGLMGRIIARYMLEKGFTLVGVIDNDPQIVGRDVGHVLGLERELGIVITDDAEAVLSRGADIAVLAMKSLMADMEPYFAACATHGINVISTCEEAFFPQTTAPESFARLDALAKANAVTLTGSGYQDVFWGNLATMLAGATQFIDSIEGYSCYNVDHYGMALAQVHGVGLSVDEFQQQIAAANVPSFAMNVPGWIAGQLGLTLRDVSQTLIPAILATDITSTTLGRRIPAGDVIGMNAVAIAHTAEGITIQMEVCGKVYLPGEEDNNDWVIRGEPTTRLRTAGPNTVKLTCATIVNRMPQVIAADPGFATLETFPRPHYLLKV